MQTSSAHDYQARRELLNRRATAFIDGREANEIAELLIAFMEREEVSEEREKNFGSGFGFSFHDDFVCICDVLVEEARDQGSRRFIEVARIVAQRGNADAKGFIAGAATHLLGKGDDELEEFVWGQLANDPIGEHRHEVRESLAIGLEGEDHLYDAAGWHQVAVRILRYM